ncbi:hypothetical protein GS504_01385 [Rhodococcus hoagii]|nr:hypothetical protein [Prescottella equi]NKS71674.1 hypothetical protein [Prescottella equi]
MSGRHSHHMGGPDGWAPTDQALTARWAAEDRARRVLIKTAAGVASAVGIGIWHFTADVAAVVIAVQATLALAGLVDAAALPRLPRS